MANSQEQLKRMILFEILLPEGKVKYLGQMITLMDQESSEVQHIIRCDWSAFARHRQELTSKSYLHRHRFHLFDAVVTPTILYGARRWTATEEHEKRSVQHSAECCILSFRQKIHKNNKHKDSGGKDIQDSEMSEATNESRNEDSTNDECDRNSSISFENDTESTSSQEHELEDWIESRDADEKILTYNITNCVETQKKMTSRQALRIATQSQER